MPLTFVSKIDEKKNEPCKPLKWEHSADIVASREYLRKKHTLLFSHLFGFGGVFRYFLAAWKIT